VCAHHFRINNYRNKDEFAAFSFQGKGRDKPKVVAVIGLGCRGGDATSLVTWW